MRIYLASFLEPDNFGYGRLISIAVGKPKHIEVSSVFKHFIPKQEIREKYRELSPNDQKAASEYFSTEFIKQLDNLVDNINATANKKSVAAIDILPFKDGDTLASWERQKNRNYRPYIANVLKRLGYDVVLH